ncbi:hypothetical protein AC1031_002482 [Aphanomyces cochlioides]|nr:hypothetical protein AC1031_002482 [Aphanomyces cochlioides]
MAQVRGGRPTLPGNENRPPKKGSTNLKRKRLTYEEKLRVIKSYEQFGMPTTLDRFYPNVSGSVRESARKNIHLWSSNRAFIEERANDPVRASHRSTRGPGVSTTLSPEVEDKLVRWICDLRTNGVPVTHIMLREKALEAAKEEGLDHSVFRASEAWINGFKRRHAMD